MNHFSIETIQGWDRFYRANFMNCLTGFKPAALISTLHETNIPNLALFSNLLHIGADPAHIGLLCRPRASTPHTYENILRDGLFNLNLVTESQMQAAHQSSARYPAEISEFSATGLDVHFYPGIKVPFVGGAPVQVALQLVEALPLSVNDTTLFIGAVTHVYIENGLLAPDGFVALEQLNTICTLGLDGYYKPRPIGRLSYAKPGKTPELLR